MANKCCLKFCADAAQRLARLQTNSSEVGGYRQACKRSVQSDRVCSLEQPPRGDPDLVALTECSGQAALAAACSLGLNLLEEALQVGGLVVEELNLFCALFGLNLATRGIARLNGLNLALQLDYFVGLLFLLGFELGDSLLEVSLAVLSLQLLAHGEGHRALIESLVGSDGHHDLVTDTEKQKAALGQVESHLTDDLVEALGEELLTHWANAALSGLTLHELLVQHFSESGDINSAGGLVAHILDPVLACKQRLVIVKFKSHFACGKRYTKK